MKFLILEIFDRENLYRYVPWYLHKYVPWYLYNKIKIYTYNIENMCSNSILRRIRAKMVN